MTLILSYISRAGAIQIADRRLTVKPDLVYDEMAIKSIVLQCRDGWFTLAFAGNACIAPPRRSLHNSTPVFDGEHTIDWLYRWLEKRRTIERPWRELLGTLRIDLSRHWRSYFSNELMGEGLTLFGTGYEYRNGRSRGVDYEYAAIGIRISNRHRSGIPAPQALSFDWREFVLRRRWRNGPLLYRIGFDGEDGAVSPALVERARAIASAHAHRHLSTLDAAFLFLDLVRSAADDPSGRGSIGRNCMITIIPPDLSEPIMCVDCHSADERVMCQAPYIIAGTGSRAINLLDTVDPIIPKGASRILVSTGLAIHANGRQVLVNTLIDA